jgi:hypothetical protein
VGKVAQTLYTHISKCKNNKIKEGKKENVVFIYNGILFSQNRE